MSDSISDRLLSTLEAIEGADKAASEVTRDFLSDSDEVALFDQETPVIELKQNASCVENEDGIDLLDDYKRSRDFTYMMQDASLVLLKNLSNLAATSAHPKAYDSVNQLLNTMRGFNKDLMEFQKILLDAKGKKRLLPLKDSTPQDGRASVSVQTDGDTLTVTMRDRPTTTNILEVIQRAKKEGRDISTMDNDSIIIEATKINEECQYQEVEEVENGDPETSNG